MDQRDAELLRADRAGDLDRLPVEREGAARRAMHAGEDLGEGRLAGAVLAQQRVDFARAQVEIDVAQHFDAGEGLGDAAGRDQRERCTSSAQCAGTGASGCDQASAP